MTEWKPATVIVERRHRAPQGISAHVNGLFAVHPDVEDAGVGWSVTLVATGWRVGGELPSEVAARWLADQFLSCGVPWDTAPRGVTDDGKEARAFVRRHKGVVLPLIKRAKAL